MAVPFDPLLICPALIGRAPHLETPDRLLTLAASGHGQIALVAGEAGVGKSRLVAEIEKHAIAQGYAVLRGRCFEADRSLPYAPLLDLLRVDLPAYTPEAIAPALGPVAAQLVGLLPEY